VRITRYNGKSTELRIPPRIGDRPVTEIGERVFMKKGLTSVVIPESVTFIGNMAFADNKIGSVSIGANVYIADNAFENSQYNPFSVAFYNSQGRKAGTYGNSWRLITASAPQSAHPGSTASAGTTGSTAPASAASAVIDLSSIEVISPDSGWSAVKNEMSTSNISIYKEQIDGRECDVLTINVNLNYSDWGWAGASLSNANIVQYFKNANGVRFKVLGDGKKWSFYIRTSNVQDGGFYEIMIQTQKGKVTSIDIPFKRLKEPGGVKFNKDNITSVTIVRNTSTGMGPATLKVFDFEIY